VSCEWGTVKSKGKPLLVEDDAYFFSSLQLNFFWGEGDNKDQKEKETDKLFEWDTVKGKGKGKATTSTGRR
jgi:hypothetical protein